MAALTSEERAAAVAALVATIGPGGLSGRRASSQEWNELLDRVVLALEAAGFEIIAL